MERQCQIIFWAWAAAVAGLMVWFLISTAGDYVDIIQTFLLAHLIIPTIWLIKAAPACFSRAKKDFTPRVRGLKKKSKPNQKIRLKVKVGEGGSNTLPRGGERFTAVVRTYNFSVIETDK